MIDLTQLKALEKNATDAPWASHIVTDKDDNEWPTFKLETLDGNALDYEHPERDAALLCYLRNNAPNLIARLEAADRMAVALEWIESAGYAEDHPITCDFQEDARYVYPARFQAIWGKAHEAIAAYRKEVAK